MALIPVHYDEANVKVTAATDTESGLVPTDTKAVYSGIEIENEEKIEARIYLNETPNPGETKFPEMPCLILGGEYKGQTCYYRVDFFRTENDVTTYHDILRNHCYELTVLKILGNGSPSEEEAYNSVGMNLEIEVMEWDESNMSNIVFEGKYYLKVNQSHFRLDREHKDRNSYNNKLTIETNHEEGWVIDRISEPDDGALINMDNGWIQIAPEERSGPMDKTTISILLEENDTGAPRSAEIHLQVGRLIDFIVSVTQYTDRKVELHIEDLDGNPIEEIVFYDYYGNTNPHEPKGFRVRWSPYGPDSGKPGQNFECVVRTTPVGDDYFDFKAGTEEITTGVLTDASGMKEYIIEPEPFSEEEVSELLGNPFLQHASWITFTVTDPDDANNTVSKTIYLNHQHVAISSRDFRRLSYLGRSYEFHVLANTPWEIEEVVTEDEDFSIINYTPKGLTGGNNIARGDRLTYTTSAERNPGGFKQAGRKATFYLRDKRGIIPELVPFTISAVYEDPNCYIISPSSSSPLSIPIRKLFWIREREAGDASVVNLLHNANELEPCIVWEEYYTQSGNPSTGQANLIIETAAGSNNLLDATLKVPMPSGVIGNALVGVRRKGEEAVLWSWHIWLTDYNPDSSSDGYLETEDALFMYRNLGAFSGDHTLNAHTVGLYYQWGRKDPLRADHIPGNIRNVADKKIY